MAMIRIVKRDLSLGWTTWRDGYREFKRTVRLLQGAAQRMARPKLVAAFSGWRDDTRAEKLAKASMSHEEQMAVEIESRQALQREVDQLKTDLAAARQAMLDGSGREAELSRLSEEQLAKEREKRIEHAQHMAMMRLTKRDLVLGWSTWHDKYQIHARQKRLIQRAGARVLLPKLTAALGHWRTDWEVSEREKRQMTVEERFAKLEAAKEAAEAEAASLRIELKKAQQAMVDGSGREEELRNAHEISLAAEREKRIEHAQHMAAMRIIKKDLVLGWTCWHEKWSAYARKRRLLQGAASRLAKPKLVACVHLWRKDWEVTMARKAKLSHKEQLVQSENLAASLQREVAQLKARLIEIGGKHEQERQAERERRIEQVGQMAMLRIVKKDLALGWTTWYDLYEARARSKRLLQGAAGRIAKPKLAAAVSWWRRDYLAASSMSHTEMVASEKSMRIAAEAEANRLRMSLSSEAGGS